MSVITEVTETTITVCVPLGVRRRNGRPRIMLPDSGAEGADQADCRASAPVLRAIARAWDWRRRLAAGEFATLQDIADAENVTMPYVSRLIRLAYLSPTVLDRIVTGRAFVAAALEELAATALEPWPRQSNTLSTDVGERIALMMDNSG